MPHYRHAEYDDYVEGYREAQNAQIALSGETADFFAEYKVRRLAGWLPEFTGRPVAILDYGCGDGLMTSFFGRYFSGAVVHGVDSSAKSITLAQSRYPGIVFACVQEPRLPFPDRSLDLIVASSVFHHIPFAAHHMHLQECFRALKPGGAFVLFELNPFNPFSTFVFIRSPFDKSAKLMFPGYAKRLLTPYGRASLKFSTFFPSALAFLRPLESYLEAIPLGAHYACMVRKPEAPKPKS